MYDGYYFRRIVFITAFAFVAWLCAVDRPTLSFSVAEDGAAWVQAIGSVIAIGIAIYVPYWQKSKSDEFADSERRIYAAAFGIQLRPRLEALRPKLRRHIGIIADAISRSDENKRGSVYFDVPDRGLPELDYLRKHWKQISRLDHVTAKAVIRAVTLIDYTNGLLDEENIGFVEEATDGEKMRAIENLDRGSAQAYRLAYACALTEIELALKSIAKSQIGEGEIDISRF